MSSCGGHSPVLASSREFGGHVRRIAPQPLQPVKAAAILGEDVEDEVAVIEQDPAAGRRAFDEQRLDAIVLAKLVDDAVGDGLRPAAPRWPSRG